MSNPTAGIEGSPVSRRQRRLGRYAFALAVSVGAGLLRVLLGLAFEPRPPLYSLFVGAVGLSAWFGGFGPGLLSVALCAVSGMFFLDPTYSASVSHLPDLLSVGIFAVVSTMVAWMTESLHAARRSVDLHLQESLRASAAARSWKERYEAAVQASGQVLYDVDPDSGRVIFAGTVEATLGRPAELDGYDLARWRAMIHADDVPRFDLAKRDGSAVEYRLHRLDGREVIVQDTGRPLLDRDGRAVRIVGFLRDVTAQRRAERCARARGEQLRLAVETTKIGITAVTFTADGLHLECSAEVNTIFALSPHAAPTLDALLAAIDTADRPEVLRTLAAAVAPDGDAAYSIEARIHRPDGALRWVHFHGRALLGGDARQTLYIGVVQDITERRAAAAELAEAHRRLAESAALLRTLMDEAPVGFAYLDHDLRFVQVNEKLAEYDRLPAAEHLGRDIADLLPGLWSTLEPLFRRVLADGRAILDIEVTRGLRDPRDPGAALVSLFPLSALGAATGLGMTVVDLTAQKRAEEALREADRRKDSFIATLAHELRNPLAPIRSAVTLLQRPATTADERARGLDVIGRQVDLMARLLDDLLDVARFARGKMVLRREHVDLAGVLARAVETVMPLIRGASHRLVLQPTAAPIYVDADPMRLAQVFTNLLTNATRYTERGGTLRLTTSVVDDAVEVLVEDTGVGIDPADLPRLFEPFSQIHPAGDRPNGGLGLGLALSRAIVGLHGGTITARSPGLGRGSTFTVRLPTIPPPSQHPTRDDHAPARSAPDDAARPCEHHLKILVADDNIDAAEMLSLLLKSSGAEVRTAFDGDEALRLADEFTPDVAILDIGMPKLDGHEIARRIRLRPWGRRALLIALTGWGQTRDRARSSEAGFDTHLTKPVDLQRLLGTLARARHGRPTERAQA